MYQFWGKVRKSNQRGKKLGFPTANISLYRDIPEGIYISKTKIAERIYKSLTFIGIAKTFNEKKIQSETNILDFNANIYGKWISVELLKKIRNNQKFASSDELIAQMKKDAQAAREYFSNFPLSDDNRNVTPF
ncbi:MAG: riboflavin kinase / FMN adenylyltransferase [Microgenomates group bacterium Gr01-1014_7]|nr:MAG: riboflavin kinase / FMN adenylyltransferase [Microgenomates group bacterium Gr01-1014_7]